MAYSVLLVDDDACLLHGLRKSLDGQGCEVLTAADATAAVEQIRSSEVDVVVADERMAGVDWSAFLGELRRRSPDAVRVMVIGLGSVETAIRAVDQGDLYRFFIRPCNASEVAIAIRHALSHRELLFQGRELLDTVKRQAAVLDDLERHHPGMPRSDWGTDATGDGDAPPSDVASFLAEAAAAIEQLRRRQRREQAALEPACVPTGMGPHVYGHLGS